ncbi:MAG: hypothetical protein WAO46_08690, partial [Tepidanaerobacteraceae bacterium]
MAKMGDFIPMQKSQEESFYTDVLINELYPDESYKGFRYVSKYFVTDDKICYVEFLWNQDD